MLTVIKLLLAMIAVEALVCLFRRSQQALPKA